ncbi:HK97 gp10 family phage protein [Bacillus sp. FJAT-49732]|uniref:HK97 gp10 family phage protein n=1 Tax=Lederbergia citrisecunda TaxID=2833583 RepID=A0A942TIF3_9BACI|nr:HK97-gp10 family putative phage morphogenesis protein [Lederbergia citrisecunda]MBS4198615.1 HK97 gp10 family phage protein [Lederbergia citrisecunda]
MAKLEISGLDDNIFMFEQLGEKASKVENKALKAGGEVIKKYQIENVNRSKKDQEHMQDNITVGRPKETDEGKVVIVGPNQKVAYRALFLEYGTSKMAARPFIDKSADQGEAEAVSAMEKVFLGALKK